MKVAVIIPCFNEEHNIREVIRSVHALQIASCELVPVVVNDHSTDRSAQVAAAEDCVLLNLPVNLGIGGAVQTGYRYAYENHFDCAVQMDGDGQHPAEEMHKLLQPILRDEADVVIGSRFIDNEGFQSSYWRRVGIRFFKHLLKFVTGHVIRDSTSGFRAINSKVIRIVASDYPDDYPEPVAIVIYSKRRLRMQEVAVEMKERQGGQSSIGGFSSFYYMIKVSMAICFTYFKQDR